MHMVEKACPIVVRRQGADMEVLAFVHPSAGKQFVKGTIKSGENPIAAAKRELREESGIVGSSAFADLGVCDVGPDKQRWHFFCLLVNNSADSWLWETEDDFGHVFRFFWHPIKKPLGKEWHPVFHEAFAFFSTRLVD